MDMDYKKVYEEWLTNPFFDEATRQELAAIKDDEREIKERFYMDLEFGTAGLRGIIGAGTNRMNNYIVAKATQGLANYIKQRKKQAKGCLLYTSWCMVMTADWYFLRRLLRHRS